MCSCPNTCVDHVLGRMSEKSGCGVSFGTVRITDLDFVDVADIFTETTELLAGPLDSLIEEAEPLGLRVSWINTIYVAFTRCEEKEVKTKVKFLTQV